LGRLSGETWCDWILAGPRESATRSLAIHSPGRWYVEYWESGTV